MLGEDYRCMPEHDHGKLMIVVEMVYLNMVHVFLIACFILHVGLDLA